MKTRKRLFSKISTNLVVAAALVALSAPMANAAKNNTGSQLVAPASPGQSTSSTCGDAMIMDKQSGRLVRQKRVDLVVVSLWMRRTDNGVAVKPTIRNRCPDSTRNRFRVAIDGVTISMGPLAGNTTATGQTILLGNKTSYRVTVDSGRQIREVNERNNNCTATRRTGDAEKTHRCR